MRPVISSLWIGDRLSYLEQLCLKSFADHGHRVKLYSYSEIDNLPKGVEAADANEILPDLTIHTDAGKDSPAKSSDKFRYYLLAQTDEIWVDCDAYCVRPFPNIPYIFAPDVPRIYNNGVLRLPRHSPALHGLLEFTSTDYPKLPVDWIYYYQGHIDKYHCTKANGTTHVSDMFWGVWGPHALTYFLKKSGEDRYSMPSRMLYPFGAPAARNLANADPKGRLRITLDTYSIHLFGSALRQRIIRRPMFKNNLPFKGSFIYQRLIDHEIDPTLAPLVPFNQNRSKVDNQTRDETPHKSQDQTLAP